MSAPPPFPDFPTPAPAPKLRATAKASANKRSPAPRQPTEARSAKRLKREPSETAPTVRVELGTQLSPTFRTEIGQVLFESENISSVTIVDAADSHSFALVHTSFDYAAQVDKLRDEEGAMYGGAQGGSRFNPQNGIMTGGGPEQGTTSSQAATGATPTMGPASSVPPTSYTRTLPVVFAFAEFAKGASTQLDPHFQALLAFSQKHRPARSVLIVKTAKPWTPNRSNDLPAVLARGFIHHNIDVVDVVSYREAAVYLHLACDAILKSAKKKISTNFSVRGDTCKSVPLGDGKGERFVTWVSMLMEVPGCTEEPAKAVAERYPDVVSLLTKVREEEEKAALEAAASGAFIKGGPSVGGRGTTPAKQQKNAASWEFLAEIEVPQKGKKEFRRLGPVLAARICRFFGSSDPGGLVD